MVSPGPARVEPGRSAGRLGRDQWAERVARFNRAEVPDFELEHFLFGVPRGPTRRVAASLRQLQEDRYFYCAERLRSCEVDHFFPWARHPDDGRLWLEDAVFESPDPMRLAGILTDLDGGRDLDSAADPRGRYLRGDHR